MITFSGREITVNSGTPELIDIAIQLGRLPRWAGNTTRFFPVLLHSFVVADLLPKKLEIYGLLHDATELWFGDIPSPVKPEVIRRQEYAISLRLYRSLGLKSPTERQSRLVKEADIRSRVGEVQVLGPNAMRERPSYLKKDMAAKYFVKLYVERFPNYRDYLEPDGSAVREFVERVTRLIGERHV